MKHFVMLPLMLFFLNGCSTIKQLNNQVNQSTYSIYANREAVERDTAAIHENQRVIQSSTQTIQENKKLLEEAAKS